MPKSLKLVLPFALLALALLLWRYAQLPAPAERAAPASAPAQPVPSDPRGTDSAIAVLRRLPAGNERSQSLLLFLDALGRTDPDRALALARELVATRDELAFYSSLFDRLARENIATAIPRLAAVPPGEARANALRALTDAWVRADFPAAQVWAQSLPAADRSIALETVLLDLAPRDPLQAIELAQKNITGPGLERVILNALEKLGATDPQGAAGLVRLLPPGEMQTQAAMFTAYAFGVQQSATAAAWARSLPEGNTRTLALNSALAGWATRDVSGAGIYVSAMPPGSLQHTAAIALATIFGTRDPPAAITWAQSLPATDTRPAALTNIASAWATRDPAAATVWAATQTSLPPEALRGAFSYWRLQNAEAARHWLDAANLPAETKAQLRGGAR